MDVLVWQETWIAPFGDYHAVSAFGNENELFFPGRVISDRGIGLSHVTDSRWRNFKMMYKRFMTWTIPEAQVEVSFEGVSQLAVTDGEGYDEFRMKLPQPIRGAHPWQKIRLEPVGEMVNNQTRPMVYSHVFVPFRHFTFEISLVECETRP